MNKISSFVIAMVVVSMVVFVISSFVVDVSVHYGQTYDNSTLAQYNKFQEINSQAERMNQTLSGVGTSVGALDVIGDLLKGGYTVIEVSWNSFATFTGLLRGAETQMSNVPGMAGGEVPAIFSFLLLIALLVFIFSIVGILIGRDV